MLVQFTANDWPAIPFAEWQTTAAALHLESTYEAAASLGEWDRTMECERGRKGEPPPIG